MVLENYRKVCNATNNPTEQMRYKKTETTTTTVNQSTVFLYIGKITAEYDERKQHTVICSVTKIHFLLFFHIVLILLSLAVVYDVLAPKKSFLYEIICTPDTLNTLREYQTDFSMMNTNCQWKNCCGLV